MSRIRLSDHSKSFNDKMQSGTDLNDDNLWICRVTVRVLVMLRYWGKIRVGVAHCCIQTAGKSDQSREQN